MFIKTEIEIEDSITEECAWVPCVIKIDSIAYVRPYINDQKKYEGASVCLNDGTSIHLKMKYDEIANKILDQY